MKIALPLILLLATAVWTDAETSVILQQTNSPIQILRYTNHAYGLGDRITHSITFTNTSRARVTRIQFGFASFDAFNSYMGSLIGWEGMAETNSQSDDSFNQRNDQVIRFEEYGTGVAYVKAVRFDDGTIWRADMGAILFELQKFEKDLKPDDLKEKKENSKT